MKNDNCFPSDPSPKRFARHDDYIDANAERANMA